MRRTQVYITDDQAAKIRAMAKRCRVSQAVVIRQLLDAGLETGGPEAEARAGILATAGILANAPDRPEWQAAVRGRSAAEFLGRYRRSHAGIDLVDHVIAATTDVHMARLATLNVERFPMFPRLEPPFS